MPCYQTKTWSSVSESLEVPHFDGTTFLFIAIVVFSLETLVFSLELYISGKQLFVGVVPFNFIFFFVVLFILVHGSQETLGEISTKVNLFGYIIGNGTEVHHD